MAVAVMGLEIDPSRKSVDDVAGAESSRSDMPNPADHTGSPSSKTAAPMPGTLFPAMKVDTAISMRKRFFGGGVFCGAEAAAASARSAASNRKNEFGNEFVAGSCP